LIGTGVKKSNQLLTLNYTEEVQLRQPFATRVENVTPYYEPLIPGQKRGRHIYWTNFKLPLNINERDFTGIMCGQSNDEHKKLEVFHDLKINANLGGYRDVLRNLVDYEVGKTIFETALGIINKSKTNQITLEL
jgi:DNA (cytosine-5)-methyltransferase 1